jgi:glucan phosphoethanolaminetransferase (alkaline phosphatase superfamily)
MKLFNKFTDIFKRPKIALLLFPLQLIVPNVMLCFTESMVWNAAIANVALPLGIYYLLLSLSPKIGRSILYFIPSMAFAAFQIVLLSLYGQSIIGVDMLLNVVTTNSGEVAELLGNLIAPMALVLLLYLTPIIWGIVAIVKKWRISINYRRKYRPYGWSLSLIGVIMIGVSYIATPYYSISTYLFPINVVYNVASAINRTNRSNHYDVTSKHFKYNAISTHASTRKEVYVMVIGETGRAREWQLLGYDRETTPHLCATDGIVEFRYALTESNTTHKSVPMLMSTLSAENFDSIYTRKGIITAFKEAGFATAFLSMQRYNHSFIDFFGMEADTADFIRERQMSSAMLYDMELIAPMRAFIEQSQKQKILLVLHTYGSHFNYKERYPDECAYFRPDIAPDASLRYREQLINAYDNSIRYTDLFLSKIIDYLSGLKNCDAAMIYASDHGEDIFDDNRGRFLHASPVPTYYQLHVPMLLWLSQSYREHYPEVWLHANTNKMGKVSTSQSMANTILDVAGVTTPYLDYSRSLCSPNYKEPYRVYLNDRNAAIDIRNIGLKKIDLDLLKKNNLN